MNRFGFIILSFCIANSLAFAQDIVINEFMQSNIDCIMDDLNEYPDSWVELYNSTEQPIPLKNYKIGIKEKESKAYQLPDVVIASQGFVTIYCDKEGKNFHTDFRLESGKNGAIYLFKDGEIIDKIEGIAKMPAPNVAYGRELDGSDKWGYQLTPTPGTPNTGKITDVILGEPVFNVKGGILTSPVSVNISIPDGSPEGVFIVYTLDGSEPTELSDRFENEILIDKNSIIRAKLIKDGALSPRSTTHSYIFHGQDMTLPIISIVGDKDDFYSDEKGILSDYIGDSGKENFNFDWRRPVNFEFFDSEESPAELNQLCETRLKGHGSRVFLIKSMIIYANKRFGTSRLDYEFFPDQKPNLTDFKSIELRNAGNDCNYLYLRDAAIQRIVGPNADIDWAASQPVVVYINGEYHGILNLRERANEDHIYTNYNGLEDIDIIENWSFASEGEFEEFEKFREFYSENRHSFDQYEEIMDIDEFCNYFVMNTYFSNRDFPGNNSIMWRPQGEEGKWRWIAKDMDLSMGIYNLQADFPSFDFYYYPEIYNQHGWVNEEPYTRLLRNLCNIPEFRDKFLNTFLIQMGDFLKPDYIFSVTDDMSQAISEEYPRHMEKNVYPEYHGLYKGLYKNMKTWLDQRHEYLYSHLSDFFQTQEMVPIQINFKNIDQPLFLNDIKVNNPEEWSGNYPKMHSLTIKTSSNSKLICEVTFKDNKNSYSSVHISQNPSFKFPKDCVSATITVRQDSSQGGIDKISEESINFDEPYSVYDIQGRIFNTKFNNLPEGIYIIEQKGIKSKILKK